MKWETSPDGVPEAFRPQVTIYDEANGQRVATAFRADAVALIAAAPDMLAALEEARNFIADRSDEWDDEEDHLIRTLDDAINKAKETT